MGSPSGEPSGLGDAPRTFVTPPAPLWAWTELSEAGELISSPTLAGRREETPKACLGVAPWSLGQGSVRCPACPDHKVRSYAPCLPWKD